MRRSSKRLVPRGACEPVAATTARTPTAADRRSPRPEGDEAAATWSDDGGSWSLAAELEQQPPGPARRR